MAVVGRAPVTLSLAVFVISAAFAVYVLAGYPLLLDLRARRRAKPVQARRLDKTVTVLLAVHNGERWLAGKLRSLLALDYPRGLVQILVISDGSTDRTDEIARQFSDQGVDLIRVPGAGKAAALNAGLERASGEILFFTDVRQLLAPESLRHLVAAFADPDVGVVSGELVIADGRTREELNTGLYWRYEKWIRRRQSLIDSVIGATGAIYAMRSSLARPLPPQALLDDVHLPLGAFFSGYRVVWDDKARAFDQPTSLRQEFRRKVRTQAGVYQILLAWPQLLGPGNRMWLDFVSHKLGRLLLPFALITAALATLAGLPHAWAHLAASAQGVGYGLALADMAIPEGWPLKRATAPFRAMLVLVAAAFCGASILLRPDGDFWRRRHGVAAGGTT